MFTQDCKVAVGQEEVDRAQAEKIAYGRKFDVLVYMQEVRLFQVLQATSAVASEYQPLGVRSKYSLPYSSKLPSHLAAFLNIITSYLHEIKFKENEDFSVNPRAPASRDGIIRSLKTLTNGPFGECSPEFVCSLISAQVGSLMMHIQALLTAIPCSADSSKLTCSQVDSCRLQNRNYAIQQLQLCALLLKNINTLSIVDLRALQMVLLENIVGGSCALPKQTNDINGIATDKINGFSQLISKLHEFLNFLLNEMSFTSIYPRSLIDPLHASMQLSNTSSSRNENEWVDEIALMRSAGDKIKSRHGKNKPGNRSAKPTNGEPAHQSANQINSSQMDPENNTENCILPTSATFPSFYSLGTFDRQLVLESQLPPSFCGE